MSSLSEITGVDKKDLREKFKLEPLSQYDRNESENCLFMSPTVLLEDSELRHGGLSEMGAEKVLSLVTKDILQSKDYTLFQVPEITCLHMGYGKNSANKEGKMAMSENDAKTWFNILNLKLKDYDQAHSSDDPQVRESTETMEVDPCSQLYNDIVPPSDSGLLISQKGSHILFMSILLINSQSDTTLSSEIEKMHIKGESSSLGDNKAAEHSTVVEAEAEIESKGRIGANKISDFLSFWTLPYLLNYTHRKVQEIEKHHEARNENPQSLVKTVKKSTINIITEATQLMPAEILPKLREKLEKYYSTEKLQEEYTLLKCDDGSPVVLVPLQYVFDMGKAHPLRIEDLGRKWESDGKVLSRGEFLNAFVRKREIQKDYFKCMQDAQLRQGVDYAIIFPDKDAFEFLLTEVRNTDPNVLTSLKHVEQQGRGMISPRHSVVKCNRQNLVLCFAYFQGTDSGSVAALFRAVGAHYLNHFTVVFLHGSTLNKDDPDCKLGYLYPVREAVQLSFEKEKLKKADKISFRKGISKFVDHDFPSWYDWWLQNVSCDADVGEAIMKHDIEPFFDPTKHGNAAFSKASHCESLRNAFLRNNEQIRNSNMRKLARYRIQAANLNGHLLSKIQNCGRKDNIGVILAISNTLGPHDPPSLLKTALNKIIFLFVVAVVNAGLKSVFPSEPDEKNREEIYCESSPSSSYLSMSEDVEEDIFEEEMEEEQEGKEEEMEEDEWDGDEEDNSSSNTLMDEEEEKETDTVSDFELDAEPAAKPRSRRTEHGASNLLSRNKKLVKRVIHCESSLSYLSMSEDVEEDIFEEEMEEEQEGKEEEMEEDEWDGDEEDNSSSNTLMDEEEEKETDTVSDFELDAEPAAKPRSRRTEHGASNLLSRNKKLVKRGDKHNEDSRADNSDSDSSVEYLGTTPIASKQTEYSKIEEYSQQPTTGGPGTLVTPPTEEAVQIKAGTPEDEELESLASNITDCWKPVGRRLRFKEAGLTAFERENHTLSEQAYKMLLSWKESNGRCATFEVLYKALTHELVNRRDLAERM
ncbi:hypothetical protein ACROYT_G004509 [Oculina patagonica]